MLKSKKIVDWLYDYSLYFIIGALLLVIIAIEPSFVRVSNFTTILTQSATKIIYACGIAGIIVLGGTDLALGREVGLAAVVAASLLQAVDYSQRVFSADQVPALPLIVPLLLVMVLLGIICAAHGVKRTIIIVYIIAGLLYAFGGVLEAGRTGSANSTMGADYAMDAIAACVVGGVSMKGGTGTLPGVVIGVIIFQIISYGLIYIGVSPDLQYVVKGLIIIVAVVLDNQKSLRKAA